MKRAFGIVVCAVMENGPRVQDALPVADLVAGLELHVAKREVAGPIVFPRPCHSIRGVSSYEQVKANQPTRQRRFQESVHTD